MRTKPTSFYSKAARAFRRVHGYPHDPAKIEHQKFMCGWQHGYLAGKRKRSRPNGNE